MDYGDAWRMRSMCSFVDCRLMQAVDAGLRGAGSLSRGSIAGVDFLPIARLVLRPPR
ncbi:hypothetical protein [Falsiroseomonas sp. HW251]|uniref:hypothetical protein n=1 Tax=Falsiroseomonas sp. HW251 TaxID=3390998 RepID=UPI003D31AF97